MSSRRQFLSQLFSGLAFLAGGQWATGLTIRFYSTAAQASGWLAWVEDKAGRIVGFFTSSGRWIPFRGL